MAKKTFEVGDIVQLTGKHLRNTGQYTGGHEVWAVVGFWGKGNTFALVSESNENPPGYYTPEEMAADPMLRFRSVHTGNLQRTKKKQNRFCD